jgi:hypothetical protein
MSSESGSWIAGTTCNSSIQLSYLYQIKDTDINEETGEIVTSDLYRSIHLKLQNNDHIHRFGVLTECANSPEQLQQCIVNYLISIQVLQQPNDAGAGADAGAGVQ